MHIKYKIQNKIISTTNDDESNFVKVFCTYSKSNYWDLDNLDFSDDELLCILSSLSTR